MGDVKQRIIGIGVLIPLIGGVAYGGFPLLLSIVIIQAFLIYEVSSLFSEGRKGFWLLFCLISFASVVGYLGGSDQSMLSVAAALAIGAVYLVTKRALYATLFTFVFLVALISLSNLTNLSNAAPLFLAIAFVIAAGDIGAYFVGRRIGGPKLAPAISPGKTISGAIGGLVFSVFAAFLVAPYLLGFHTNPLVAGSVIAILGQSGDLYESFVKRRLAVKDSSNLIPGHGGFLDRFDGYLFVLPVFSFTLL